MIDQMQARGSLLEPGTYDRVINDLTEMYGLEGSWFDQYWAFGVDCSAATWRFPFFQFPTRVNKLIFQRDASGLWAAVDHDRHHVDTREYHWAG
jgi:peptide/nickel transport system permease protein